MTNVNHRARQRAIPAAVGEVIAGLDVDIVVLNEFVDGPIRSTFREQLARFGYSHQLVSHRPANNNQVFAASRTPIYLVGRDGRPRRRRVLRPVTALTAHAAHRRD